MTHTDRAIVDKLLSDIDAIRTTEALKIWGIRWARDIQASGYRDEIAKAYLARMETLETK